MLPVIALVGRPNVGKSTLFNRLTRSRDALVANMPGLTRDRQYGHATINEVPCILVDTGGIAGDEEGIDGLMAGQSLQAMEEADLVLFLVDVRAGLNAADEYVAERLRRQSKPYLLLANKIDGLDAETAVAEFFQLGLGDPIKIAASQGRGINHLKEHIIASIPALADEAEAPEEQEAQGIKIGVIGRPNVGKSTLVNRLLGEERVVVYDLPGTTRDSIYIEMERFGNKYTLIDTAGVRKRGRVTETVEKFSVLKTLQAIEDANVVIMVFDARESVTEQDMHLLGFVLDAGRSLVIAFNKWDGMSQEDRDDVKADMERRLGFVNFARVHFISALHGTNVGHLFESVDEAWQSANVKASASSLTELLELAIMKHQPPTVRGRRVKLRYAHIGGHNPPRVVIHGNQTDRLPDSYQRYLSNHFRKALKLVGTPIRLELRSGDNPFKGKKNELTERQKLKRKRAIKKFKR